MVAGPRQYFVCILSCSPGLRPLSQSFPHRPVYVFAPATPIYHPPARSQPGPQTSGRVRGASSRTRVIRANMSSPAVIQPSGLLVSPNAADLRHASRLGTSSLKMLHQHLSNASSRWRIRVWTRIILTLHSARSREAYRCRICANRRRNAACPHVPAVIRGGLSRLVSPHLNQVTPVPR